MNNNKMPVHPGVLLKNLISESNMQFTEVAFALNMSRTALYEVVNNRSGVTIATAVKITKAFGGTAEYWLYKQLEYDLWVARQSLNGDLSIIPSLLIKDYKKHYYKQRGSLRKQNLVPFINCQSECDSLYSALKNLRVKLGLSVNDILIQSGMCRKTVTHIEKFLFTASLDQIIRYVIVLRRELIRNRNRKRQ